MEGAAHCAACHTGRNVAGARASDTQHFQGNDRLPGGGKSPAIDFETLQKRGWTVDNLAFALKTGVTPTGDALGGTMGGTGLFDARPWSGALPVEAVLHLGVSGIRES